MQGPCCAATLHRQKQPGKDGRKSVWRYHYRPFVPCRWEIKNSVIMGYSNKARDGYLGDSVIGTWCNLGAGTSNSNLKNNAGEITLHIPTFNEPVKAGTKCGRLWRLQPQRHQYLFNTGTVMSKLNISEAAG